MSYAQHLRCILLDPTTPASPLTLKSAPAVKAISIDFQDLKNPPSVLQLDRFMDHALASALVSLNIKGSPSKLIAMKTPVSWSLSNIRSISSNMATLGVRWMPPTYFSNLQSLKLNYPYCFRVIDGTKFAQLKTLHLTDKASKTFEIPDRFEKQFPVLEKVFFQADRCNTAGLATLFACVNLKAVTFKGYVRDTRNDQFLPTFALRYFNIRINNMRWTILCPEVVYSGSENFISNSKVDGMCAGVDVQAADTTRPSLGCTAYELRTDSSTTWRVLTQSLPQLSRLSLSNPDLAYDMGKALASSPVLQKLSSRGGRFGYSQFARWASLTRIDLVRTEFPGWESISLPPSLTYLRLSQCSLSGCIPSGVLRSNVSCLRLDGNRIDSLQGLQKMASLKILDISDNNMGTQMAPVSIPDSLLALYCRGLSLASTKHLLFPVLRKRCGEEDIKNLFSSLESSRQTVELKPAQLDNSFAQAKTFGHYFLARLLLF